MQFLRYGNSQQHNDTLRVFSMFTFLWSCSWGLLLFAFCIDMTMKGKYPPGESVLIWIMFMAFFCGWVWVIQYYWEDKVRTMYGDRDIDALKIQPNSFFHRVLPSNVVYGLNQNYSSGLKTFTLVTIFWTLLNGIGWSAMAYQKTTVEGEPAIVSIFVVIFAVLLFCGWAWFIQWIGVRRVISISEKAEYWITYYREQIKRSRELTRALPMDRKTYLDPATGYSYHQPRSYDDDTYTPAAHGVPIGNQMQSTIPYARFGGDADVPGAEEGSGPIPWAIDSGAGGMGIDNECIQQKIQQARNYEIALRFEPAAKIYEECEMWEEAGRMRMKDIELNTPKSLFMLDRLNLAESFRIENSVIDGSTVGDGPAPPGQ